MKRSLLLLGFVVLAASFNSCKKYKNKEVFANVPVYQDYDSFRGSFSFTPGVAMQNAGNIFVHNNFILINDIDKGIHIFDNTDPSYPYSLGFMNIPGNTQMDMRGNVLYANSFIDLLAIDLSNVNNPVLVDRMENVFNYSVPMINESYPVADISTDQGVVVSWSIEKTKNVSGFMKKFNVADCADCDQVEVETKNAVSGRVNLAGSMSRFAVIDNYLYALDQTEIKSFNITNASSTTFGGRTKTWAEAETLFPSGDHIFVGTTTGMMIYDSGSDREFPNHVSSIEHVESCDPVVVDGDYAYLTLRSGSDCGGSVNEYQVIDVSNKSFPDHEESFDMTDPHGLAIDGDLLFICDGDDGLKVFNVSNPLTSGYSPTYHFPEIKSRDIILNDGLAIMIAEEGVYQYDYSNPSDIVMLGIFYF